MIPGSSIVVNSSPESSSSPRVMFITQGVVTLTYFRFLGLQLQFQLFLLCLNENFVLALIVQDVLLVFVQFLRETLQDVRSARYFKQTHLSLQMKD